MNIWVRHRKPPKKTITPKSAAALDRIEIEKREEQLARIRHVAKARAAHREDQIMTRGKSR